MKKFNIDIPNLIWNLLPPHKRQETRFALLECLINLRPLYEKFDAWRSEQHRLINMNSQAMVLREYLRLKFGGSTDIRVLPYSELLLLISLSSEGQYVTVGFEDEYMVPVPLFGEASYNFGDADFIVIVPGGSLDMEALRIEVEKFKMIDTRYRIIEQEDLTPGTSEPAIPIANCSIAALLRDYLRTCFYFAAIRVTPFGEYLKSVSLFAEGELIGVGTDNRDMILIPFVGEVAYNLNGDHLAINIPLDINPDAVKIETERFKEKNSNTLSYRILQ
ncbi:hypothetical protein EZS27_004481 [termite gut metagenome]|uniref:Uncharacterized protein n=1 Tax=termite gut metagenome TaxID=433724 RepID=A0A5J4SP58_9ZZZZ